MTIESSISGSTSDLTDMMINSSLVASFSGAAVSDLLENNNNNNNVLEFDLEINEFFMPAVSQVNNSNNVNISISLRNSLLKLRHTRRHLAKLIESKKCGGLSGGSSTSSGSLTSLNNTGQFNTMKQMTISALSR